MFLPTDCQAMPQITITISNIIGSKQGGYTARDNARGPELKRVRLAARPYFCTGALMLQRYRGNSPARNRVWPRETSSELLFLKLGLRQQI